MHSMLDIRIRRCNPDQESSSKPQVLPNPDQNNQINKYLGNQTNVWETFKLLPFSTNYNLYCLSCPLGQNTYKNAKFYNQFNSFLYLNHIVDQTKHQIINYFVIHFKNILHIREQIILNKQNRKNFSLQAKYYNISVISQTYNSYRMLVRNIVTQENQIKKFLTLLCQDNPIACAKESISRFFSNDRVIVVRNQYFQFYNKPQKFKKGDISALTPNNFKARVHLNDIYQLHFLPEDKVEKKTMMLSIPLNKLEAKNIEIYKSNVTKVFNQRQEHQNYIVNWTFIFEFDVKADIFRKLQQEEKKQKQQQMKIIKYDPSQQFNDSILNISSIKNNQPDSNPVQQLDNNVQKLKQIRQFIDFKQKLQKQQQERQNMIKKSLLLRKTEKGEVNQDEQGEQQEQIFPIRGVWKQFWNLYEKVSRFIGQPPTKEYLEKQLSVLSELHKIQVQVKNIAVEYIDFRLVGWGPDRMTFDSFEFYKGIWIKVGGKQLNQQFLSNYYLSDLMYIMKSHKKMKFRIPPMFLIVYKCCKLICMIDLPCNTIKGLKKQIYNIKSHKSELDFQLVNKIKVALQLFERILNIKTETFINGSIQTNAPLGQDVKVYQYDNKFEQASAQFLQNFYYVVGVKGLFPIDYQFQLQKYQPEYCIRPQIIAQYRDYMESIYRQDNQLLTQAFKHSEITLDVKGKQDAKVAKVSRQFIPLKIKRLMHQFNQINLILIDSYSIKRYMSQMGINARYLGQMYNHTQIPYIQQTLKVEMLARIIKSIYYDTVKQLVGNQNFYKRQLYLKKHKDVLIDNMNYHNQLMVNNAIDYLNLVFGVGKQSQQFWKIVLKKCQNKYGVHCQYPLRVKSGCLLHAVLWHCGLIINFDLDIKLFQAERPFNIKNWVDFRFQSKSFDFPSFQVNKIIKKMSFVQQIKKDDQLQKFLFSFLKIQLLRNYHSFGLGLKTQITLSKINYRGIHFEKPVRDCNYHPTQLPYYFSNKSHQNFKKAVDIINFSLASNHPLFISLYNQYSKQFQPELLKKSTLLAAIKGLGEFHPRTTELYSRFYRQGLQQFQIKAKRSEQIEAALIISEQMLSKRKYQSCLNFCFQRIKNFKQRRSSSKGNELVMFIQILKNGLVSAVKTRFYQKGLYIAEQFSEMINTYKIRTPQDHEVLLQNALIIRLNLTTQKFYLYKMVLLAVKIQKQHQSNLSMDEQGLLLPRGPEQKLKILIGIMNEYYLQQTHSKWIQHIFIVLRRGYLYFNYLNDLFNNYKHHIKRYGMIQFQNALGFLDILIRYFGQKVFQNHLYSINN